MQADSGLAGVIPPLFHSCMPFLFPFCTTCVQICEDDVQYNCNHFEASFALRDAVVDQKYPPELTFKIMYDTSLTFSNGGEPTFVHIFIDDTSKGQLQFPTAIYRRRTGEDNTCNRV